MRFDFRRRPEPRSTNAPAFMMMAHLGRARFVAASFVDPNGVELALMQAGEIDPSARLKVLIGRPSMQLLLPTAAVRPPNPSHSALPLQPKWVGTAGYSAAMANFLT